MNTRNRLLARLPYRRRRALIAARVAVRARLDPSRPLPDAIVIGAQRSGTSSLYKWLEGHPDVVASVRKETEYFTNNLDKGERWYRAHFPSRARHRLAMARSGRPLLTFEATPSYLSHPHTAERVARTVPNAKLIALVRDPVERAWSQYQHEHRAGREQLSFEDAIAAETERLAPELQRMAADPHYVSKPFHRFSYVTRGHYAEQLEHWLRHFDRDRLLILRSEDLWSDSAVTLGSILTFLGLAAWTPPAFANVSPPSGARSTDMADETRAALRAHFAPHNERLGALLGADPSWD